MDPDADATNIEWRADSVAFLDTELTVDCRENFYSNETLNGTTTQVQCVETGWWVVHPCVRGEGALTGPGYVLSLQIEYYGNLNTIFLCLPLCLSI